jgi:hypothetical protein
MVIHGSLVLYTGSGVGIPNPEGWRGADGPVVPTARRLCKDGDILYPYVRRSGRKRKVAETNQSLHVDICRFATARSPFQDVPPDRTRYLETLSIHASCASDLGPCPG